MFFFIMVSGQFFFFFFYCNLFLVILFTKLNHAHHRKAVWRSLYEMFLEYINILYIPDERISITALANI